MQATRFLMTLLQEINIYIKNSEEKKRALEDHISNFIFERSLSIFNTEDNNESQSEIMCYMYYFVCGKNYPNSCWEDENLNDETVKRNNLINLSKSIAKDMIDHYIHTNIPVGAAAPPQNEEENNIFVFLMNIRDQILS